MAFYWRPFLGHVSKGNRLLSRCKSSAALFPRIPDIGYADATPEALKKQELLSAHLSGALKIARDGGSPKAILRHTEVNKKLLPRERLRLLLDEDALDSFVEISPLAGLDLEYGTVPCAGLIVGIGQVSNTTCLVIVSETTVKGGSTYPITLKKQLRAQEIALQNRLPIVYVIDSGGAFLPLQVSSVLSRCRSCHEKNLRQDPLEAILVIFGRRALIFFVWKRSEKYEKWHHFCAHAHWWSPWRRKNVEKEQLAPSSLTFLLIAIDRNGFCRMKEEGLIYKLLPQIF